ncbi:MAG: VOC family protein [Elusimicrobia bacterium]|nr:VOC family protein [Elusimicrobiota bacterium]
MPKQVKPIPDGFHAVTPGLCVNNAASALDFYKRAFGASELMRMPGPGGKIMHAKIKIGDSIIFVSDEFPEMPNSCRAPQTLKGATSAVYLYVEDVDASFAQAVKAGGKVNMPLTDMFWGDRYGQIQDPFGHIWALATHKEDLTPEQMKKRQQEQFATAK